MQHERFQAMILALEENGVTRQQIVETTRLSHTTVWRLAELPDWRPTLTTARRISDMHRQVRAMIDYGVK